MTQTPSELVWKTVRLQNPERLPRDIWILPAAERVHGRELARLLGDFPLDFARVGYTPPVPDGRYTPGHWRDEWGALWVNSFEGILGQVTEYPLDDWKALEHWKPPFADIEKGFERAGEELTQAGTLFRQGGDMTLFHRLCWLRQPEKLYLDLLEEPPEWQTLFDAVVEWNSRRLDVWLRYDYEGLIIMDDWGTQRSMLISPELWRQWFKPVYADWFARIRKTGRLVFFHSDGYILPIIEDLVEIGVDALNCQVRVMGEELLAEKFAGRICFWGELDRQLLLPRGTPEEVRKGALTMMNLFARPEGGFISQFELGWDVPPPNFRMAMETFARWRRGAITPE